MLLIPYGTQVNIVQDGKDSLFDYVCDLKKRSAGVHFWYAPAECFYWEFTCSMRKCINLFAAELSLS